VKIGSKPIKYLTRALDSLANQTHRRIAVTFIQCHPLDGIDDVISRYRFRFRWLRHQIVANDGKCRTAWWAGLKSIEAEFLGVLEDDDSLHPNHVATVLDYFERYPESGFVYSGMIRVEEEGHYIDAINFQGPAGKVIEETRELEYPDSPDLIHLVELDHHINSSAWLCRSSVLNNALLDKLEYEADDEEFYMAIADRTVIGFTGSPTVVGSRRSGLVSKAAGRLPRQPQQGSETLGNVHRRIRKGKTSIWRRATRCLAGRR
jgi:hypothetical protein